MTSLAASVPALKPLLLALHKASVDALALPPQGWHTPAQAARLKAIGAL